MNRTSRHRRKGRSKRSRGVVNTANNHNLDGSSERVITRNVQGVISIPRNVFAPPAIIVDLFYVDLRVDNNAGSTYTSYRLRINGAYDPDPALGSGALPGFTEWAAIYRNYRVIKYEIEAEVSNLEAFPITVVASPSQADLGLNYSNLFNLMANPGAVSRQLSAKGGIDRDRFKITLDLGTYYGNTIQWFGNDSFGATTSANPTTLFYMNVGCVASSNLVSGFTSRTIHRYRLLFSGRGVLNAFMRDPNYRTLTFPCSEEERFSIDG